MSGPKYSRYSLSPAERKRLLEERLKRQRIEEFNRQQKIIAKLINLEKEGYDIKKINEQKHKLINSINTLISNIDKELISINQEAKKLENIENDILKIKYDNLNSKFGALKNKNERNSIEISLEQLNDNLLELNSFYERILEDSKDSKNQVKLVQKDILDNISKKIDRSVAEFAYKDYFEHQKFDASYYLNTLNDLVSNPILDASLLENLHGVIKQLEKINEIKQLKDFCLGVVSQLIDKCQRFIKFHQENGQKFDSLVELYEKLSLINGEEAKNFNFDEKSLIELENTVLELQQQVECDLERQYIASQFNQILVEMGYKLLGQKSKVINDNMFYTDRLYSYENGNVASVTFASNGQISIEIGSLDNVSRQPNFKEAENQVKSMEKLCEDLPLIEEKLKEKGIYLKQRIAMQPACEEVAQIFNGKDYNIQVNKEQYAPIQKELYKYLEDDDTWL